jgi:hypothetical protein
VSSLPGSSVFACCLSRLSGSQEAAEIAEGNVLSTGKSSNSSSSSKAAAGFVSFVSVPLSVVVALVVCGAAPEAGAADIVRRGEVVEVAVAKNPTQG